MLSCVVSVMLCCCVVVVACGSLFVWVVCSVVCRVSSVGLASVALLWYWRWGYCGLARVMVLYGMVGYGLSVYAM